jgi:hypothetical protein
VSLGRLRRQVDRGTNSRYRHAVSCHGLLTRGTRMSHQMLARRSMLSYGIGGIASFVLLAFASRSRAEVTQFKADLKGSNQVPLNQATGTGTVTATYDSATKRLSWNGSYSGLSGPPTAAHIHGPAAAGTNARLVFWISDDIGQCSQGECRSNSDTKAHPLSNPFQGSATLTDAQAADLMAGMYYVNIHTDAYPRGEIRGQLVKSL